MDPHRVEPTLSTIRDLGDLLAQGGAIVGGGAALYGAMGFLAALAKESGMQDVDPREWAERAAQWGAIAGLVALVYRIAGVE